MNIKVYLNKFVVWAALAALVLALAVFSPAFTRAYADTPEYVPPTPETVFINSESDFYSIQSGSKAKKYILTTDIYLDRFYAANASNRFRIPLFEGELCGMGHAIVGFRSSTESTWTALIDVIAPEAKISDLKIIDASVTTGESSNAAILCVKNLGTIENVSVSGRVSGGRTAGIAVMNYGTIRGAVSLAECLSSVVIPDEEAGEDLTGVTPGAAITVSNSSRFGAESQIPERYADDFTPVYDVSYCYGPAGSQCVADGTNNDNRLNYNAGNPFADGVSDYVTLKLYADWFAAADDLNKPTATQTAYVNMYNAPLTAAEIAALDLAYGMRYDRGNFGFRNNAKSGNPIMFSATVNYSGVGRTTGEAAAEIIPVTSNGVTYYPVASAADLLIAKNYDGIGVKFLLTEDISLLLSSSAGIYPADGSFFPTLSGTLEGNGKVISGLTGPLVGTISESGKINNLTVYGKSPSGLIADTNNGAVENSAASGIGLMLAYNNGAVRHCSADTTLGVAYSSSTGTVYSTRNYGGEFFKKESEEEEPKAKAENSLDYSGSWNACELVKCVCVDGDNNVTVSEDTELTSLVNVNTSDIITRAQGEEPKPLYSSGWRFGTSYGFGFISGISDDIPTVVFPEDRTAYKGITKIKTTVGSYTRKVGSNAIIGNYSVLCVDRTEEGFDELPVYGEDTDIRYLDDVFYFGQSETGELPRRSYFEYVTDSVVSSELKAYIAGDEDAVYSWYIAGDAGEIALDAHSDAVGPDIGTYRFRMNHRYLWVTGEVTLSVTGGRYSARFGYKVVQYGIQNLYAYGDLGLQSVSSALAAIGLVKTGDNANPIGYEGVTAAWTKDGEPYAQNVLSGIGEYTLKVSVPATLAGTATEFTLSYVITAGDIDLDEYEVASAIGGLTLDTAPTYNGIALNAPQSTFSLNGFSHYGTSYSYEIITYNRPDGTEESASALLNAGTYTLLLTVNVEGYNPAQRFFEFHILRKKVLINANVASSSIKYFDEHPAVSYTSADFAGNTSDIFPGLSYESVYVKGSNSGSYYTVSVKISEECAAFSRNYLPVKGAEAQFYVGKATLDLSAAGFVSAEITYDGKPHSVSLDKTKIKVREGDYNRYTFTVTYGYDGEVRTDTPFTFTSAGVYDRQSAHITLNSPNYESATISEVTLTVKRLTVTLEADDLYVAYGDTPVYTLKAYAIPGNEVEDYLENIVRDVNYTIGSAYETTTTAGSVLEIVLAIKGSAEVGNYTLQVAPATHTLTVGKRDYTLNMRNEYVYTGLEVALDFLGSSFTFDEGYPKFYLVEAGGGRVEPFTGVPVNANVNYSKYRAEFLISESAEYNRLYVKKDFTIIPKPMNFSGLCLYINDVKKGLLSDNLVYAYSGADYRIDLDWAEADIGIGNYQKRYRYNLYDNGGAEFTYESDSPILLKHSVRIKDVSVYLTAGSNYLPWGSLENLNQIITSFTVSPAVLSFETYAATLPYKGANYSEEEINALINSLTVMGLAEGESVTFLANAGDNTIRVPDDYGLQITQNNGDYTFSAGDSVGFTLTVEAVTVELDFTGTVFTFAYGEVVRKNLNPAPRVTKPFTYLLSGAERTSEIVFTVDTDEVYPVPYEYAISSALPLTDGDKEAIRFNITNAEKAIKILPKELTYDWSFVTSVNGERFGFASSYPYSGAPVNMPAKFARAAVSGSLNEDPDVRISYSGTLLHAGSYTLTADTYVTKTAPDGSPVKCYYLPAELKTFGTIITPKLITYSVVDKAILAGESYPDNFSLVYAEGFAPFESDTLAVSFTSPDFNGERGEYAVYADIKVSDGGELYSDYLLSRAEDCGKLTVTDRRFPDETTVEDIAYAYNGLPLTLAVKNVPEGLDVTLRYSARPVNKGEYDITVTLAAEGYADKVINVKVNISAADVTLDVGERTPVAYKRDYVLSSSDIVASATFGGEEVRGEFRFTRRNIPQSLVYGRHTYSIEFIPESDNFKAVRDIEYTFDCYFEEMDAISAVGKDKDSEQTDNIFTEGEEPVRVTADKEYLIVADIPENLQGLAILYVNGSAALDGVYSVKKSASELVVEIRVGLEVIRSTKLSVTVLNPQKPAESEKDPTPTNPDKPSPAKPEKPNVEITTDLGGVTATINEDKKKILIIVGASVGGALVLGAAAAAIVIVLKKKKKGE